MREEDSETEVSLGSHNKNLSQNKLTGRHLSGHIKSKG